MDIAAMFSDRREWWPVDLLEESMPPGRATPQAWLEPDDYGCTPIWWDDEETKLCTVLEPGQEVGFIWYEPRGSAAVRLHRDGTWSVDDSRDDLTIDMFDPPATVADGPHAEAPGKAGPRSAPPPLALIAASNAFWDDSDSDTLADTIDEFARSMVDIGGADVDQPVTVNLGFWSFTEEKFRVSRDGRSLEPVATTEEGSDA